MQTTARLLLWAVSLLVLSSVSTYAADPPAVQISNGVMRASVYLPDSDRGYYRGGRFDWSGVISRLEYAGHNYFGVWFPNSEPTLHDAITGPVEEFRSDEGALGFAEASRETYLSKSVWAFCRNQIVSRTSSRAITEL